MPKLTIDGKEITVEDGVTILKAAWLNGIPIPHFCFHKKLSLSGNCRMCLVQVEKMGKPQTACTTIVQEGMVVHTKTPEVKALQKNILEFILINHPIDCPVCDQAGECMLQEYYMQYSLSGSNFDEEKGKKPKKVDLGPYVMLDDERCILCSRCIRFCDEISKTGELSFSYRGDRSTLTTFPGKRLDNKYSLNTVDVCPVGALTSKPFRFQKRVWFLKSAPSVCTGCSNGCNIFVDYDDGKVWRYRPRDNDEVNQCWACDEGRLSYEFINENRLIRPMMKKENSLEDCTVSEAMEEITKAIKEMAPEGIFFLGSAYESNENNAALKKLAEGLQVTELKYSAHEGEHPYSDDFLIKADKNPNRVGVERLGFKPFAGGAQLKVVISLEGVGKSDLEKLKGEEPVLIILLASNRNPAVEEADVVLPTSTFAEQEGSFVNFQDRVQKFEKALDPQGEARPAWQWIGEIAKGLGVSWNGVTPEKLLEESLGVKYADLEGTGKVLE